MLLKIGMAIKQIIDGVKANKKKCILLKKRLDGIFQVLDGTTLLYLKDCENNTKCSSNSESEAKRRIQTANFTYEFERNRRRIQVWNFYESFIQRSDFCEETLW